MSTTILGQYCYSHMFSSQSFYIMVYLRSYVITHLFLKIVNTIILLISGLMFVYVLFLVKASFKIFIGKTILFVFYAIMKLTRSLPGMPDVVFGHIYDIYCDNPRPSTDSYIFLSYMFLYSAIISYNFELKF